jgi:hypothetical protein
VKTGASYEKLDKWTSAFLSFTKFLFLVDVKMWLNYMSVCIRGLTIKFTNSSL